MHELFVIKIRCGIIEHYKSDTHKNTADNIGYPVDSRNYPSKEHKKGKYREENFDEASKNKAFQAFFLLFFSKCKGNISVFSDIV